MTLQFQQLIVQPITNHVDPVAVLGYKVSGHHGEPEWEEGRVIQEQPQGRLGLRGGKGRLHQAVFQELVIGGYGGRCALTGLPEKRLLHAAHILPELDRRGEPVVNNGIAMSVLHHSTYDQNLLGIDPDLGIHINRDLMEIHDGPTLRYALHQLDGKQLRLPIDVGSAPSREFLAERYEIFLNAALQSRKASVTFRFQVPFPS